MASLLGDARFALLSNHFTTQNGWNRKLCFEARDTLFACADSQENGNKYRCPDELYAYEMWCPGDFRRVHSFKKRKDDLDSELYNKEYVDRINSEKQRIGKGHWVNS